jgi:predicted alpha/beta-hydrolase family hydrolase
VVPRFRADAARLEVSGDPDRLRIPTLIVQGERDPMGRAAAVADYRLSPSIELHWLADGDHPFRPRRSSGRSEAQAIAEATTAVVDFLAHVSASGGARE